MHVDSLQQLAVQWITDGDAARPSPNTVTARIDDLSVIGEAVTGRTNCPGDLTVLETLKPEDLSLDRLAPAMEGYASSHAVNSTRRVMSTWRQFCLWLVRHNRLNANPFDHIETPARDRRAPKPLSPDDIAAVAKAANQPAPRSRDPWPERDRALFALLIGAGLRVSEAVGLTVGDCELDSDPPQIHVTGSSRTLRTIPIPPEAADRIQTYLVTRADRDIKGESTAPLLGRSDGRPMTRSAVDHTVRGWFQRSGRTPPSGALVHSFRHTYATMLMESDATLSEVQALLGHADLTTTQAYARTTPQDLANAAMASPARKLLA